MKKLLIVLVLLVVVVLAGLGYVWYRIDDIAKDGIERGGTYALGVDTKVELVAISLLGGTMKVNDVTVANPKGYPDNHLLMFESFDVSVKTGSLFEDTVVIPSMELNDLDLYIQKDSSGKMNVSVVSDHLAKIGGGGKTETDTTTSGGKKVQIDRIVIDGITAHVDTPLAGQLDVKIEEPIVLENVTQDNASGVATAEIYKRVWPAILAAIIEKGGGIIPADLLNDLQGDLTKTVASLGGEAGKMAAKAIEDLGGNAGKLLEGLPAGVSDSIKEGIGGLGEGVGKSVEEGIGNLIPGANKKPAEGEAPAPDGDAEKKDPIKDGLKSIIGN